MVNLVKLLTLGVAGATAILFLREAATKGIGVAAGQTGAGIGTLGSGLSSVFGGLGTGFQAFGTGVGTGTAQLLNPLFTLRDLIYGPQAGQQAAPTAATEGVTPSEQPPTQFQPSKLIQVTTKRGELFVGQQIKSPSFVNPRSGDTIKSQLLIDRLNTGQDVFAGQITTKAGGERTIIGSPALFERLRDNLNR